MKRLVSILLVVVMSFSICACSTGEDNQVSNESNTQEANSVQTETEEPDLTQIRSICKLATLECYYHNVAKSTKEAGSGISHWGEKDRKFWTEYTGVAKIGVDMSRGSMDVDGTNITIYIPEAEILSIKPDSETVEEPIMDANGWNKNDIDGDDVTGAVNEAQTTITEMIQNDSSLLANAQDRAKKLIENYINQLGEASNVQFTIEWVTIHNNSSGEEDSE